MKKEVFGTTKEGKTAYSYTMENKNGMEITVLDFGAILHKILLPNADGTKTDIALGCEGVDGYYNNGYFLGSTIGPSANRIAGAVATIDGVDYELLNNDDGNNLHTVSVGGLNMRLWDAEEGDNCVKFTTTMADMEMGLPGNRVLSVTYTLTDDNEIRIDYHGTSDKNTIINMTNHSYFNLKGHKAGNIMDHEVYINADTYTAIREGAIPTGEIAPVAGLALDFSKQVKLEKVHTLEQEQMALVNGFDHNYVINDYNGEIRLAGCVYEASTGRTMKVYSDLPGMQFYSGNWIKDGAGKEGMVYQQHDGLCMETQYYPDFIHHDNFPQAVFGPGKEYNTTTIYQFS